MEATPLQIVGCVFSLQPAADSIDDFATQARRERAVVTAKNPRQATFVKFGATDARLVLLACRMVRASGCATLRFGFACSTSGRAPGQSDGVRVSSRSLAQASDLAAAARDGEVLLAPQLAALLAAAGLDCRSHEVHLPGDRTAVACSIDAPADNGCLPPDRGADRFDAAAGAANPGDALRALAAQVEALQRRQEELEAQQQAMRAPPAAEPLQAATAQVAALHQTLHEARQSVDGLGSRLHRSQQDLQFVLHHLDDLTALRASLDELLGRAADADDQLAQLESRRQVVEEVQSRAERITHMLGDMHANLELVGEQRAVIDDVGEKLARLDFTVQEAHNTLRALQRERELAERVEQGIKALRARTGAPAKAATTR